ncbi:MAG: hypothetical protein K0Q66_729 [Chitinophagaceae bacterium]|jgi:hypothetical protein|nr:hypothetical protein [Chitinophagaceae bacterium]
MYLQMLKQEGYLDEDAVQVTCEMYSLTPEEGHELLQRFKTEKQDVYVKSARNNAFNFMGPLFLFGFFALIYFVFADGVGTGDWIMALIAIFFLLGSIGVIGQMILYGKEALTLKFPLARFVISHKLHSAMGIAICFALFFTWQYFNDRISTMDLKRVSIVLEEDCRVEKYYTKGSERFKYVLRATGIPKELTWMEKSHLGAFITATPDRLLQRNDSVEVWIDRGDRRRLHDNPTFFHKTIAVYQVSVGGRTLLDISRRDRYAMQGYQGGLVFTAIVMALLVILFFVKSAPLRRKIS